MYDHGGSHYPHEIAAAALLPRNDRKGCSSRAFFPVIASEARQSWLMGSGGDCFVALLLATTGKGVPLNDGEVCSSQ